MNLPSAGEKTVVDLLRRSTLGDYGDIAVAIGLRTVVTQSEELPRPGAAPVRRATAAAVICNPWLGPGEQHDLSAETGHVAPVLAKILTERLLGQLGGADAVQAFGKAALVGTAGEIEHAGALIHTPYFGNLVREALGGTSIICFADGRADAGEVLRVPLWHKTAAATRDYYQTLDVVLSDAPHKDEIVVIAAASTGPRPHARLGDRRTDGPITTEILKEIAL